MGMQSLLQSWGCLCITAESGAQALEYLDDLTPDLAKTYGPHLEVHPNFPNRTNVQFMQIIDRKNVRIEIWERGAGYTMASGSSSSASAAVARKMGLVDADLAVNMPGGQIIIGIGDDYSIVMTGPTTPVGIFEMHPGVPVQDAQALGRWCGGCG